MKYLEYQKESGGSVANVAVLIGLLIFLVAFSMFFSSFAALLGNTLDSVRSFLL